MKTKNNAFTFIELLVTITIVTIPTMLIVHPLLQKAASNNCARYAFNSINKIGLKEARKIYSRDHIKYGLERKPKLFTQEAVDAEQKKYIAKQVRDALSKISKSGIENLSPEKIEALRLAIVEKHSHNIDEVKERQEKYEKDRIEKRDLMFEVIQFKNAYIEPIPLF